MKRASRIGRRYLLILGAVGMLNLALIATAYGALINAYGTKSVDNHGVMADIEVADPPVNTGDWSIIRVWVNDGGNPSKYAELGHGKHYDSDESIWLKESIIIAVGGEDDDNSWLPDYPVSPVGPYEYKIERKSSPTDNWEFRIDGSLVATKDMNFSLGKSYNCGGELSNTGDGMGVAACLDNKYKSTGGSWTDITGATLWSDVSTDHSDSHTYHTHGIVNSDWQMSGNN